MKTRSFLFLISGCFCLKSLAQPLGVGDYLPAVQLNNIINHKNLSIHVKELAGKAILLDFAASTCVPCIKMMPLLDSLQNNYKDELQIFIVTKESKEKMQRFMQTNRVARQTTLPAITEDSLLNTMFPHEALPHEVWINKQGKVVAITDHHKVTGQNIEKMLRGEKLNWPVKKDEKEWNIKDQALKENIPHTAVKYYSLFSEEWPGYRSKGLIHRDSVSNLCIARFVNFTAMQLYKAALHLGNYEFFPARIRVHPALQGRLPLNGENDSITAIVRYCCEWQTTLSQSAEKLTETMFRDLNTWLGINTCIRRNNIQCWILQRTGEEWRLPDAKTRSKQSLRHLLNYYNRQKGFPPFLNETGLTEEELGKLFVAVSTEQLADLAQLRKALHNTGFCIIEESRILEILEFSPAAKNP